MHARVRKRHDEKMHTIFYTCIAKGVERCCGSDKNDRGSRSWLKVMLSLNARALASSPHTLFCFSLPFISSLLTLFFSLFLLFASAVSLVISFPMTCMHGKTREKLESLCSRIFAHTRTLKRYSACLFRRTEAS